MPFADLEFRHPWRAYQERVLTAIDRHLDDQRLHVVAAPGAGKTTLGLEVFRRLRRRAIVLSPTRTIRDQWIARLEDFRDGVDPFQLDWVSRRVEAPKVLTSVTYQALHAQVPGREEAVTGDADEVDEAVDEDEPLEDSEVDDFVALLERNQIGVLILDEAHHLRAEWWRAIDRVCGQLPDLVLVSLTATPPYDAANHEWQRYEQLCGPIDEEISVPELVKAGTLCPHQDYVWAVDLSQSEKERVRDYDARVEALCDSLFHDQTFLGIVQGHPWTGEQEIDVPSVLAEPEIAVALLVFVKAKELPLPAALCSALDTSADDVPELGRQWWQTLVEGVLFSSGFALDDAQQEFVDGLKRQLRASELLRRRELSIVRSRRLDRSLALSAAKVDACVEIHRIEVEQRADALCQVVLTDFIRDEARQSDVRSGELTLGAWPTFRGLIGASPIADRVALLSGRISALHRDRCAALLELVDPARVTTREASGHPDYLTVEGPTNQLTSAFTTLLLRGEVRTLVGTRALLGEGWDAPAVNSLVLASFVGSFMLTNQMRGRAIRTDRDRPDKISSIWHLVALDTESFSGARDFDELQRRFQTFVGLSEIDDVIESGFERMNAKAFGLLQVPPAKRFVVLRNNEEMRRRHASLATLPARWRDALTLDDSARVLPSVYTQTVPGLRGHHVRNTLRSLLFQFAGLISLVLTSAGHSARGETPSTIFLAVGAAVVSAMLFRLPATIRLVRTALWHLPPDGSLRRIGVALAEALCRTDLVETSFRRLKVACHRHEDGTFYVALAGGTFYESSLFADCLAEILAPIDNPRYLVVREGELFGLARDDYHAVPLRLGVRKELAEAFYSSWRKHVCVSELIYTRTDEGRRALLKARSRAFSSTFANEVKRLDRWQGAVDG